MTPVHLDTDYLIKAVSVAGEERARLLDLARSETPIAMSAIAWYEFARGPRTPEQLALASLIVDEQDIVAFDADLARIAADTFRKLGYPRRRAADIAIGTTAAVARAVLWSLNRADFAGIPELELGPGVHP